MRKTKQTYVKPETEVVELKVQGQILAGSGTGDEGTHSAPEFELEN